MVLYVLIGFSVLQLMMVVVLLVRSKSNASESLLMRFEELRSAVTALESSLKTDFRSNREEMAAMAKSNREELAASVQHFRNEMMALLRQLTDQNALALERLNRTLEDRVDALSAKNESTLIHAFRSFQEAFDKNVLAFNDVQREKFALLVDKQQDLVKSTELKLETIRTTVEEKLEKTLSDRLGQSFETVGKQLIEVQRGLGEMQHLAQDVGGLKRVLSNVKMRGGIGEVQLAMLLEQILAPEQYEANVKTKQGSNDLVEFAIKLPGKQGNESQVWLPVDAKFPSEVYENLQTAMIAVKLSKSRKHSVIWRIPFAKWQRISATNTSIRRLQQILE